MKREDIKNLSLDELKKVMAGLSASPYRAEQIFFWIYKKGTEGFKDMLNIPKDIIDKIEKRFYISSLSLCEHRRSSDGTEKILFGLSDGNFIETVLIHTQERKTICVSTQAGCRYSCPFCASGTMGFIRDLTASEIVGQVLFVKIRLRHKISNCVFMGMGEPLDNYYNTEKAILIMNERKGLDIGSRRITISTCGIIPGIERLKDLKPQVNLSLSLHAVEQNLRDKLVPANRRYPLGELIKVCENYIEKKGRIITLEYLLIKGKNDSLRDAEKLAKIAERLKAKINLLACNSVPGTAYKAPHPGRINLFMQQLKRCGAKVTLRKPKGKDIDAACGQLAGKIK